MRVKKVSWFGFKQDYTEIPDNEIKCVKYGAECFSAFVGQPVTVVKKCGCHEEWFVDTDDPNWNFKMGSCS